MEQTSIIGTGIYFPVAFSHNNKTELLETVSETDAIKQSIRIILGTEIGERYNNPNFGSKLQSLIFEPNNNLLKDLLYFYVIEALSRWEPRINITNVVFINYVDNENVIGINIFYSIKTTHTKDNYVYPFVRGGESFESLLRK